MRYMDSIFVSLLKPIDRRQFGALVERQDGDAYDKSFKSWDHLVALLYAQFSHAGSLRGVVTGFNANDHHHYHLGVVLPCSGTTAASSAGVLTLTRAVSGRMA